MEDTSLGFEQLASNCDRKRRMLLFVGHYRIKWKKILSIISGTMALCSAASMTAVFTDITSSFYVKLISAIIAFLAGFITIIMSTFFDENETIEIFSCASKFLSIRERAMLMKHRPNVDGDGAFAALEDLRALYADNCASSDRFVSWYSPAFRREFWSINRGVTLHDYISAWKHMNKSD